MDIAEQLEKLAALHAAGVLTEAEYLAAKARVIGEDAQSDQAEDTAVPADGHEDAQTHQVVEEGSEASPGSTEDGDQKTPEPTDDGGGAGALGGQAKWVIGILAAVVCFAFLMQVTGGGSQSKSNATVPVRTFLLAKDNSERFAAICRGSGVPTSDMRAFYPQEEPLADEVTQLNRLGQSNWWPDQTHVQATWTNGGETFTEKFKVIFPEDGAGKRQDPCLMWSASPRYAPSLARIFHDGGTAIAYMPVKLADYYNWNYRSTESSHYSLRVMGGLSVQMLHGFVEKSRPGARAIFNALEHGDTAMIRAVVSYPSAGYRRASSRNQGVATLTNARLLPMLSPVSLK